MEKLGKFKEIVQENIQGIIHEKMHKMQKKVVIPQHFPLDEMKIIINTALALIIIQILKILFNILDRQKLKPTHVFAKLVIVIVIINRSEVNTMRDVLYLYSMYCTYCNRQKHYHNEKIVVHNSRDCPMRLKGYLQM